MSSVRPSAPLLALVACLLAVAVTPAASTAAPGALQPLRSWGQQTAKQLRTGGKDKVVQQRLAALRKLVPGAARRLQAATQADRDAELRTSRHALDLSLGGLPRKLSTDQAFALFVSYQSELERLARLAHLGRAATGRVMLLVNGQPRVAQERDEIGQDTDHDGVEDEAEADDDNDGVADGPDASRIGWGIPDAFVARPCVRITEEIPSYLTVTAAADWLRIAVTERDDCSRPRAERDVRAPRGLRKLGVTLTGARVDSTTFTATVVARAPVRLRFVVREADRALATAAPVRVKAGRRTVTAALDRVPSSGLHTVLIDATSRGRSAKGVEPVGVGAEPEPVHEVVGDDELVPVYPTPEVRNGHIVDVLPSGETAECPDENRDSDHDGVADCVERRGFDFHVFLPGQTTPKTVRVTSDPHRANTDGDAEEHDGRVFALTDGQEWANAAAGGISDPSRVDGDGDELTDVAEIHRWGTNPAAPDSDNDARGPNRDQPPSQALYDAAELRAASPTSPTLADTDGDGRDDYTEIVTLHANALVADLPAFDIARVAGTGVTIALSVSSTQRSTTLTSRSTGSTVTDTRTDSSATDVTTENKGLIENLSNLWKLKGGAKPPTRATSRFDFGSIVDYATTAFDVASPYLFGNTTNKNTTMEISTASQKDARETYEDSIGRDVTVGPKGTITASFQVQNVSDRAIEVRDLGVAVFAPCIPLAARDATASCSGGQLAPLGTLVPVTGSSGSLVPAVRNVTLDPRAISGPLTFQGEADAALLQRLLGNPGGLVFRPSGTLYDPASGKTFAGTIGESVNRRTGGLTVDYDDGRVQGYAIGTAVNRAWGAPSEPTGIRVDEILHKALGLESTCPQTGGRNCFVIGDAGERGKALLALGDPAQPAAAALFAKPVKDTGSIAGAWVVFGKTRSRLGSADDPASVNLAAVRLAATDRLTLAYAADVDGDRLFDREERLLGTSDQAKDSDGDGASGSGFASDYFEARVGWLVPFPPGRPGRQVYSSPISCDLDADGLPDGGGNGCPLNTALGSEHRQLTDPNNPDTNGDDKLDGVQDKPLSPTATPVVTTDIKASDMAPNGGTQDGTAWNLPVGSTIEPIAVGLCGAGVTTGSCAGNTGYYRLRWVLARPAAAPDTSNPFTSDPEWARLTVSSKEEVPQLNPSTGQTENVVVEDNWATIRLQASEVVAPDVPQGYEVYLHTVSALKIAHLSLRVMQGPTIKVYGLTIAPVTREQYLGAAYKAGTSQPNPDFAGLAVPGRDFTAHSGCAGAVANTESPQGILVSPSTAPTFRTGVNLPAGGWRAGFSLRGRHASGDPGGVLMGMTTGGDGSQALYCDVSGTNLVLGHHGTLGDSRSSRRAPLAAAALRPAETPTTQRAINLFATQAQPLRDLRFDAETYSLPSGSTPFLEHVEIDRTPQPLKAMGTMSWASFGFSADAGAAAGVNYSPAPPEVSQPNVLLDPGDYLVSPSLPVLGATEVVWGLFADGELSLRHTLGGTGLEGDETAYPNTTTTSRRCGSPPPGAACGASTSLVLVRGRAGKAKVQQVFLSKRTG